MSDGVIRYVLTYKKGDTRYMLDAAQGRFTYATAEEAQGHLDSVLANNPPDRLESMFGPLDTFAVSPVECWPKHFDPKRSLW